MINRRWLLCFIILLLNCKDSKKNNFDKLISINSQDYFPAILLDSLLSDRVYNLKYETIQAYADKYLVEVASSKMNLSINEFIEINVTDKLISQIKKLDSNLSSKSENELRLVIQKNLIDSLKNQLDFSIKLKPEYPRSISQDSIQYFSLNNYSPNKRIVYIVSDFECSTCYLHYKETLSIIQNYNNKVHFRLVYYGLYTNPKVYNLLSNEMNPSNFNQMISEIFEIMNSENNDTLLSKYLNNSDDKLFQQKSKEMMKNNLFLSKHIFSTPVYIIDGKIYDQRGNLNILKTYLNE